MNKLFHQSEFNGDIRQWDVSNSDDRSAVIEAYYLKENLELELKENNIYNKKIKL